MPARRRCGPAAAGAVFVLVALSALRAIFGAAVVPPPVTAHVSAWELDPFARGTYSHVAVGASPADYGRLAERHGAVYFAGEATCATHPATASGAYLSGLRAAGEVLCAATVRPCGDESSDEEEEEEEDEGKAEEAEGGRSGARCHANGSRLAGAGGDEDRHFTAERAALAHTRSSRRRRGGGARGGSATGR